MTNLLPPKHCPLSSSHYRPSIACNIFDLSSSLCNLPLLRLRLLLPIIPRNLEVSPCRMSPLVETLIPSKIHPLAHNEEQDNAGKKKMMAEDTSSQNMLDSCLIGQRPLKDKGGKRPSKLKQLVLERWNQPAATPAEKNREESVEMVGISIICRGRPEIILTKPFISSPKMCLFTLKEGTDYRLKFSFVVSNNVVSGLKYVNTLWKAGIRVDRTTVNLGSYSPQEKAYDFELVEETLPCGVLVRGVYSARTKVTDSEGKCYMDTHYSFNIQKNWPSIL